MKRYQSLVLEEQTTARTFPTQAIPIFLDKLRVICSYLRDRIVTPSLNPSNIYILSRDLAFFSLNFCSGDRGSDLGQVKSADVLHLPDGEGFLINQVFSKTLRGEGNNVFGIKRIPNSPYCPVTNLCYYLALAQKISIVLKEGFLFRVTDCRGHVLDKPFLDSAVANRLKKHLKDLQLCDGETMHSFRSGCSITLSLLGASYSDVAKHVGWKSLDMAIHFCQFDKVMSSNDASSLLSCSAVYDPASNISIAERLRKDLRDRNFLKGYRPIFD